MFGIAITPKAEIKSADYTDYADFVLRLRPLLEERSVGSYF
jgi:hypothetical protein